MAEKNTIRSPLPGTFYRAPSPGQEPFVREGDRVETGDVVGMVEVMKQFSEVSAAAPGVVERFLVEDDDPVDAGQDLVELR
jgi:acetyl-CoA carboxylase biotin carboxyl carrier protein